MTAKLIAVEVLEGTRGRMRRTPESWLSGVEEWEHATRHAMTLRWLQSCYDQAAKVLPESLVGKADGEHIASLLERLHVHLDADIALVDKLLDAPGDHLMSVPKYYYSELRNRRGCSVPEPPLVFTQKSLLDYLIADAVACLRLVERFALLEGAARGAGSADSVPLETWSELGRGAYEVASELFAGAVMVFGEDKVAASLSECIKDEQSIVDDLLSGGSPRTPRAAADVAMADDGLEEDDDDDEEDLDDTCTIVKPIFIVSDCTGESAERTVRCSLGQFGHCFDRSCPADITTFRFCHASMIPDIVRRAQERDAFVVYTLVDPMTNAKMVASCESFGVEYHDLWTPLFQKLEGYLQATRLGVPSNRQYVDDKYMQLIDCIEYTQTLDDGVYPRRWAEADLMIIGPSRSGKTPLAFFMAQRGFKVANYPLVPDESIPEELYKLPQNRVFALTTDARKLVNIRANRMKTLRMGTSSAYANIVKVQSEVEWCRQLYKKNPRWNVIDTTDTGVEEACAMILKMLDEIGGVKSRVNLDNPSAI